MAKPKNSGAFLKIFSPFLVSFILAFASFSLFIVLKFKNYEVPILQKEMYFFFFSFMIAYSVITFVLVFLLYRRITKISRYAGAVSKGKEGFEPYEEAGGAFHHLVTNIDAISAQLKDKIQSADQEKNRIFAILESMTEGVLVADASQKIVMANTALVNAFELKKEDLKGKYFWEVFRDPEINEMIEGSLQKQTGFRREHSALLTNSTFEIQGSPVFSGSEFLGIIAVFHDVTKLKELERSRSEFVANVSHELKTPLTSIMGFVETLKEGAVEDPNNRLKFLQIIEEHSKKLYFLIEDLLVLSRIESGQQPLKKEPIDFEKMAKNIIQLFEKSAKAKNLKISVETHPKPFVYLADLKSMEQAITNLIDNAVKYSEPEGSVDIRAYYQGNEVKIEVKDTGIGIPEADLPRIFERFYRVDKSRSRESGGTGLGLSIVKHIIEKHSGRIEAESVSQKGAKFTIFLPKD